MKKIQLGIPQPCHENWNKMKPEEKGRFCNSCQKTVMDFREMSDRQLAEFFKRPVGSVCGRFNTDQLNRDIPIPRKHIPWVKYFFQFSFPAFLFSMKASAQGRVVVQDKIFVQEKTGFNPEGHGIKSKENNNDSIPKTNRIILKGKITDESGRAIKEASIIIIGTNIGVATDENGMYQLPCKTGDRLAIMGFGFVAIETIVNSAEMNFTVKENVCKLKEVIVTEPMGMVAYRPDFKESKRKDVGRTISKFVDSTKKLLKIFPNPVLSNNLIKIDVSQL
ncbi:MAG: carboxypeptidase-like regulatory domain-containing protein, partial [Flavitalea sp.]